MQILKQKKIELQKQTKQKGILSSIFRILIVLLTVAAFCEKFILGTPKDEVLKTCIMFTNWSVVFVAISAIISFIGSTVAFVNPKIEVPNGVKLFELGSVIAITLTAIGYMFGIIVVVISAVDATAIQTIFCFHNIARHLLIPVIAIVNFFIFSSDIKLNNKNIYVVLIFPVVGLIAQIIVFYTTGVYPYFCLNYGSRVGGFLFNFNFNNKEDVAYFMGSFYGILLASGVIVGFGGIYKVIIGKINKRKIKKSKKQSDER